MWLAATVIDGQGQLVYQVGRTAEDGSIEVAAHQYRSVPIDPKGEHVWKHDLFNRVGEAYRSVVKSGESDLVTYAFQVPYWAKGPLTATAAVKYRKLNERYARWVLKEDYQTSPIIDVARETVLIPLHTRPPASAAQVQGRVKPVEN